MNKKISEPNHRQSITKAARSLVSKSEPDMALRMISTLSQFQVEIKDLVDEWGNAAIAAGYTYREVGGALGHQTPSTAVTRFDKKNANPDLVAEVLATKKELPGVTIREACRILGLTTRVVYERAASGEIKSYKPTPGARRFLIEGTEASND